MDKGLYANVYPFEALSRPDFKTKKPQELPFLEIFLRFDL
ncbi:hypothetical protein EDO6_05017 [Paenibacillus xylanexedens]|nr:hypothetical protein EDO6_05017 [Paenibacillus xylanexedens]